MKLLLATRNRGKLTELQTVLADLDIQVLSLESFPDIPEAVEDGTTFAENARKKAVYYAERSGMAAIADDSGLEVEALGGRPGVYSARLASDDDARNRALLKELADAGPEASRQARFVCALCLLLEPHRVIEAEGTVSGSIADCPRGSNGFGYDPIFYYPPALKTFGEMSPEEKNAVSHRARALKKLKNRLQKEFLVRRR